jgi:putative copper export protein/mono/diheme cytochrome c family protein
MTWFEIATSFSRGIHVAAMLALFGCMVFQILVVPNNSTTEQSDLPLRSVTRIACASAWLALISGAVWLVAVSAAIAGADNIRAVLDSIPAIVRHTNFGNVVCLRLLLLAAVLPLLNRYQRTPRAAALIVSAAALGLQPLLGHIGASQGSTRAVLIPIEIAHLLAAGAWAGALLPLLLCVMRAPPSLAVMLCERFTPVGLVAVGTITVTALPQAGELIGGLPGLFGTQYGHFALIKLGLFCLALGLACVNRLLLTVRLATGASRRRLIISISVEAVAVLCVVLAASAMASSPPAAHIQPVWPFPWRPSTVAWEEPELRNELLRLLIVTALGLALIGGSLAIRRFRGIACVVALIAISPFAPSLTLLLVEAFPTSYAHSTTGFSVNAIVRGETLFTQQCAVCHDPRIGSGGAADLTAPHIWGHSDGDLFWWISNGVTDPEGAALMPGFGLLFSEDDRWALLDFIHARNVGAQVQASGKWSPSVSAPATPLNCEGDDGASLADLTHELLVVADTAPPVATVLKIPGAETIRLVHDSATTPGEGACVTSSPAAWEAWRVLSGVAPDQFGGYVAVVDSLGWLRAWLPPGSIENAIQAVLRDANDHPIAVGTRSVVAHHH